MTVPGLLPSGLSSCPSPLPVSEFSPASFRCGEEDGGVSAYGKPRNFTCTASHCAASHRAPTPESLGDRPSAPAGSPWGFQGWQKRGWEQGTSYCLREQWVGR